MASFCSTIEKAHPDVFNILQILEDGILTDSQDEASALNPIIMTSNVGARHITEQWQMGFSGAVSEAQNAQEMKKEVMGELKHLFKPEFLNRVDEVIVFDKLGREEIRQIAQKMFRQLALKALDMGIRLEFSDSAVDKISEVGFDILYGARPCAGLFSKESRISWPIPSSKAMYCRE